MSGGESRHKDNIGELLGVHLALMEYEWQQKPDDLERARMVTMISEAYRNFVQGGLEGFKDDFDRGYELGKRDAKLADPGQQFNSSPAPAP